MKTRTIFMISMFAAAMFLLIPSGRSLAGETEGGSEKVTVFASQGLYPLAAKWAEEYNKTHAGQAVSVSAGTSGQMGFVTGKEISSGKTEYGWQVVVGRNVVVPVINAANPFYPEIIKNGITREAIGNSLARPKDMTWGTLLHNARTEPVHFYIIAGGQTAELVDGWIPDLPDPKHTFKVVTKEEFVSAVQKDPYAAGFCNLNDVLAAGGASLAENISLMPIDKNGNGRLDAMEQIYGSVDAFSRGVWIGKYPAALTSDIFCISGTQPTEENAKAFLGWVLNEGQSLLVANGYTDLVMNERQSQLDKIYNAPVALTPAVHTTSYSNYLIIGLFVVVAGIFVLELLGRRMRKSRSEAKPAHAVAGIVTEEVPNGLYYDKTHTWVYMEQDGLATAGIDNFLGQLTGPLTRVEMKRPGDRVTKGDPFVTIIREGKKLVLYSPVSGIVREQNPDLAAQASLIHSSPYTKGWIYRIEPANWLREIQFLTMAEKYKAWIASEIARVRDFLAHRTDAPDFRYSQVVLQDGGHLKDSLLAEFGPEVWEDFQVNFLDSVK